MNISSLSTPTAVKQDTKPRPFQALASALQSGDLAGAQKAFSDMQSKLKSKKGAKGSDNDADDNMAALGSALQSGDLAGAQKAFRDIQTKMSQAHHKHHQKPTDSTSADTNAIDLSASLSGSLSVDLSA